MRIVNSWNSLPESVISDPILSSFKTSLDRAWSYYICMDSSEWFQNPIYTWVSHHPHIPPPWCYPVSKWNGLPQHHHCIITTVVIIMKSCTCTLCIICTEHKDMNIYFVTMYFCTMSRVAFDFIYYGKKTKGNCTFPVEPKTHTIDDTTFSWNQAYNNSIWTSKLPPRNNKGGGGEQK